MSEFPTYHFFFQLALGKHIANVLSNGAPGFTKQLTHLFLRQPNRFLVQGHGKLCLTVGSDENLHLFFIHISIHFCYQYLPKTLVCAV